jgi:hypothetical protein
MVGGVRFAHITLNLSDTYDATTDRAIRFHQGTEHPCRTAGFRGWEKIYDNNADKLSRPGRFVPSPGFHNHSGS